MEIFNDLIQSSAEWHQARCGVITASEFSKVLAKGDGLTRKGLLYRKAAERITGNIEPSYSNKSMEEGKKKEPRARELYIEHSGNQVVECGFIKNGNIGYSPDGLIGEDGLIEIKSPEANQHIETLLSDKVPIGHKPQIQGGLYVSGRKYLDYVSFCPGMPIFIKRVERDEEYIMTLGAELLTFELDLQQLVEKITNKFYKF